MKQGALFQRMPPRVRIAVLLSLLAHALLLRIFLGGQTFGLPGLDALWKERRADADDLRIQLALPRPALVQPVAPPSEPASPALASVPATGLSVPAAPVATPPAAAPAATAPVASVPPSSPPVITARAPSDVKLPVAAEPPPTPAPTPAPAAVVAPPPLDDDRQARALEQAAAARAASERETARLEQLRQEAERAEQSAKAEAVRAERARQDAERQDAATKAETARMEQVHQEQQRQEALQRAAQDDKARQELAQRAEATRREAERMESARREAARQEQVQRGAAQRDAAQRDAAQREAARQEQSKLSQAQQERAAQEAAREDRLRAIGAQMKQEAAQRDAASSPSRSLLPGASSLRRGLLLGRADANTDLVKYAEAMGHKIEFNQTFDIVRDALRQAHAQPLVTVAIRADGSVEKVTFVVSSGVPALDEAIRQVIASQAPYARFSPALARDYDVVEIRRTWVFDTAIRLQ